MAENPCWDYYTSEIEDIKSPGDNLAKLMRLGEGWALEPHLWDTIHRTLLNEANLNDMQIKYGCSDYATKALHLSWSIVSKRAWTLSKHSAPPDVNAKILTTGRGATPEAIRTTAAGLMKSHHENVLSLESAAASGISDAKSLCRDCQFLQMQPIRLMWEYYRRDKYSAQSPLGRHLMNGLLGILADNKIAEDIHADLRLASKGNSNLKLAKANMQDIINNSAVIEKRGMAHNTAVSEDFLFLLHFLFLLLFLFLLGFGGAAYYQWSSPSESPSPSPSLLLLLLLSFSFSFSFRISFSFSFSFSFS